MKKALVLVLSLAMVFSVAMVASAATTTLGGNVRLWYLNTDSEKSDDSFFFDRVELTTTTKLDDGYTLYTDLQGRNIKKDGTETHFFVDKAYLTKADLFVEGGKLMVGAFDGDLMFKNGFGTPILSCGLGDGLKLGQTLGMGYTYANDKFGFGLGVVNANINAVKNSSETATVDNEGYSYQLRVEAKPIAGLKAGIGYSDLSKGGAIAVDQKRLVVDASYKNLDVTPFSGLIEYGKVDPDNADSVDAWYGDIEYTFLDKKATAYVSYGDGDIYGKYITSGMGTFSIKDDHYTCLGMVYALTNNVFLQGEYAESGNDNSGFGLRLRVNF